jgi:hypothetical protein
VGSKSDDFYWDTLAYWYPVLRVPRSGEPVKLLAPWFCECGKSPWAQITFADTEILAIDAVPLDAATVAAAHVISEDVAHVYRELTNEELFPKNDIARPCRELLLAALATPQPTAHE